MRPLKEMTFEEKGIIIHQYFPDEIPALVAFFKHYAERIISDKGELREKWEDVPEGNIYSFDVKQSLANEVKKIIETFGDGLVTNTKIFSTKLFRGNHAFFTDECLTAFLSEEKYEDPKFPLFVMLLFKE